MRLYQVDAFAKRLFTGNPAAICPLSSWPTTALMQQIAAENNLSETAFIVGDGGHYQIRWFTPVLEVDLCGHATLAAAFVVFQYLETEALRLSFSSASGMLYVERDGDELFMDFPIEVVQPCSAPAALLEGLGVQPAAVYRGTDYMVVLDDERQLLDLTPDFRCLAQLDRRGIIVTAPGLQCDFVSRFFAPKAGINEDPVTGSAHCALTSYWAERLGREQLLGRQLSARGGEVQCQLLYTVEGGQRVRLGGRCVAYMIADLILENADV
jgi:PhzF family phenazine biosynthesis protein